MSEPTTLDEYNAKATTNIRITGTGLEVTVHMPCPFCAEPDWLIHRVLETEAAMGKGAQCKHCGRAAKAIYERNSSGIRFEIVQTLGDPPSTWLPAMRRLTDLVSYGTAPGPGCSYCDEGIPHRHQPSLEVDRTAVATTDGLPPAPGMEHGEAPAPQPVGPGGQHGAYFVLSDEERAKGWQRPLRNSYVHVGPPGPRYALRNLTAAELERFAGVGYVKFEPYPASETPTTGKFWTQVQLDKIGKGCGVLTKMGSKIAETYARDPGFYGATFCVGCGDHFPVGPDGEFVWEGRGDRVGT